MFRTDYKTGVLLVSHEFFESAQDTKWGLYNVSSKDYVSGNIVNGITYAKFLENYDNYKNYLVKGQGDSAIPN